MICVSLAEPDVDRCLEVLKGFDMAEIRLDGMKIGPRDVERLFSSHPRLIATCRPGDMSDKDRRDILLTAVKSGAYLVDIEVESGDAFKNEIRAAAKSCGTGVIVSYHNFEKTPKRTELGRLIDLCFDSGADAAKIACLVRSGQDAARLLGLLDDSRPLIVVGMGRKGLGVRITAPLLGSLFTFAALAPGKETAPGQPTADRLRELYRRIQGL